MEMIQKHLWIVLLAALALSACAPKGPNPITPIKPGDPSQGWYHKVVIGDTVDKIAKRYGRSVLDIVQANNLGNPAVFREGMFIFIPPPGKVTVVERMPQPEDSANPLVREKPRAIATGDSQTPLLDDSYFQAMAPQWSKADEPDPAARKLGFDWPLDQGVFSDVRIANLGIDLLATKGTPIKAARDGVVVAVLAESGALRGYGNTIFVEHPGGYTTVYAHNESNLVKKDDAVRRGQIIAKVGSTDAEVSKLHFEIRLGDKAMPVNPFRYLPKM